MKYKESSIGINANGIAYTVLLIDDSRLAREVLKQMLLSFQFKVLDEAENGVLALQKIAASKIKPDFIFIDMEMPLMGGIETIKSLKPILPDAHIIMVTAHSEKELIMELLNMGVTSFIKKPYDRDTVFKKLTSIIKGGSED